MTSIEKGNCKVYYRIFPMLGTQWDLLKFESPLLYVQCHKRISLDNKLVSKYWAFKHDGIFFNESQEFLYTNTVKDVLNSVIKGFNGVIIGYGQIGTGKSFTIHGLHFSEQEWGIAPRVILDLFKLKKELPPNIKMCIQMSYVQFSKLNAVDLLKDFPNAIDPWHVKTTTSKIKVESEYDALKMLYRGEGWKSFAKCNLYMSHMASSVLTLHITTANLDFSSPEKITSRLHIVDLVGIDSVGSISSNFKNPQDIGRANLIKSDMEHFIGYLKRNNPGCIHIKERTNPLIFYLGNDLSNESILRFIGHIRIQQSDLSLTISTLRFGQQLQGLKPKIKEIVPQITEEIKSRYLEEKLENLRKEKIFYSVLLNQDLTKDIDKERTDHLQETVHAYMHDRVTELIVLNVAEASEVFKMFKSICSLDEATEMPPQDIDPFRAKRASKTGSRISLKKSKSEKRVKRPSKESITLEKEKTFSSSIASLKGRRSVLANRADGTRNSRASHTHFKRIRSNSSSLGKHSSMLVSRKSATSSSKDKNFENKGYMIDTALIPDILPKYEHAWTAFITDIKSSYNSLYGAYKANEAELKQDYITYQIEAAKLQQYKDIVERRKTEMLEAQMFQQFIHSYDSDETITDPQTICHENLDTAQTKLLDQQETVLKLQSELKLYLNNRREIKQKVQEDFDQYCKDSYKLAIPSLGEDEEEPGLEGEETLNMDFKLGEEDAMEEEAKEEKIRSAISLEVLKNIMIKELQRNIKIQELKEKTWKNLI